MRFTINPRSALAFVSAAMLGATGFGCQAPVDGTDEVPFASNVVASPSPPPGHYCGDGHCDSDETHQSCPHDCFCATNCVGDCTQARIAAGQTANCGPYSGKRNVVTHSASGVRTTHPFTLSQYALDVTQLSGYQLPYWNQVKNTCDYLSNLTSKSLEYATTEQFITGLDNTLGNTDVYCRCQKNVDIQHMGLNPMPAMTVSCQEATSDPGSGGCGQVTYYTCQETGWVTVFANRNVPGKGAYWYSDNLVQGPPCQLVSGSTINGPYYYWFCKNPDGVAPYGLDANTNTESQTLDAVCNSWCQS
jgi:hypothetical protein